VQSEDELRPGSSTTLDRICNALLGGTDFFPG